MIERGRVGTKAVCSPRFLTTNFLMKSRTKICQLSEVLANYPHGPYRDIYPGYIPNLKFVILDC